MRGEVEEQVGTVVDSLDEQLEAAKEEIRGSCKEQMDAVKAEVCVHQCVCMCTQLCVCMCVYVCVGCGFSHMFAVCSLQVWEFVVYE